MRRETRELHEAAMAYGEATESGSSEPLAGAQAAAMLRLAAKRFFHAERADTLKPKHACDGLGPDADCKACVAWCDDWNRDHPRSQIIPQKRQQDSKTERTHVG